MAAEWSLALTSDVPSIASQSIPHTARGQLVDVVSNP